MDILMSNLRVVGLLGGDNGSLSNVALWIMDDNKSTKAIQFLYPC